MRPEKIFDGAVAMRASGDGHPVDCDNPLQEDILGEIEP